MMRRALAVLVALLLPALFLAMRDVRPAFACSGGGPLQAMLETPVIVEGRVTSVKPLPADGERPYYLPHELTFEVTRAHRGATVGDTLTLFANLPNPKVPQACPSFEFQGDLTGKYLVIGLQPDETGRLVATRGAASFVGDAPAGDEYARGVHLAEMMADSNPAAPRLTLVPTNPACGETFRVKGERFPSGLYRIHPMSEARIVAEATVGPDGAFQVEARLVTMLCSMKQQNGRSLGLAVNPVAVSDVPRLWNPEPAVEIAILTISGAVDREPPNPALTVSPRPAHCGEQVNVTGAGFVPGEALVVGVGESNVTQEVSADGRGTFALTVPLPDGECAGIRYPTGAGYTNVWAMQAAFGLTPGPGSQLAGAEVVLAAAPSAATPAPSPTAASPTPGAPDAGAGTRPPATTEDGQLGFVLVAAVLFATGVAGAAWSWRGR